MAHYTALDTTQDVVLSSAKKAANSSTAPDTSLTDQLHDPVDLLSAQLS